MSKLVLLRHGQSKWNHLNLFTGWIDIGLSNAGIEESIQAGKALADLNIDKIYTSALIRAQMTAFIAMEQRKSSKMACIQHEKDEHLSHWYESSTEQEDFLIPVHIAWQLNERMYGELQGKNKGAMVEKYGAETVRNWRRSYDIAPPGGESLAQVADRSIPFFKNTILPNLHRGLDVLICAHGNSLRSIVMHIEKLSKEQVLQLEISTGAPKIYECEQDTFRKILG